MAIRNKLHWLRGSAIWLRDVLSKAYRKLRNYLRTQGMGTKLAGASQSIVHILTALGLLVVVLLIVIECTRNVIVIEAFEVPDSLRQSGYSGRVVAQRLIDELNTRKPKPSKYRLVRKRKVDALPVFVDTGDYNIPDLRIEGAIFSLKAFAQYIRELSSPEANKISGEVILGEVEPDGRRRILLTARYGSRNPETHDIYAGPLEVYTKIEELLQNTADDILRQSTPAILANYYYEQRNYAKAEEFIEDCLRRPDWDDSWAKVLQGNIALERGLPEEAISHFKRALKLEPTFAPAYNGWGVALRKQNDYKAAEKTFRQALDLAPKSEEPLYNLAQVKLLDEDYAAAAELFEKYTRTNDHDAYAAYNWGSALLKLGEFDAAAEKFQKASEIEPEWVDAYLGWGVALTKTHQYQESLFPFEGAAKAALKTIPKDDLNKLEIDATGQGEPPAAWADSTATAYLIKAVVLDCLGKKMAAAKERAIAVRIKPDIEKKRGELERDLFGQKACKSSLAAKDI